MQNKNFAITFPVVHTFYQGQSINRSINQI